MFGTLKTYSNLNYAIYVYVSERGERMVYNIILLIVEIPIVLFCIYACKYVIKCNKSIKGRCIIVPLILVLLETLYLSFSVLWVLFKTCSNREVLKFYFELKLISDMLQVFFVFYLTKKTIEIRERLIKIEKFRR